MKTKTLILIGGFLQIIGIIVITFVLFSFVNSNNNIETKAVEYIKHLNDNKIRGGCFYIRNDSVTTFKNYK